VSGVAQTPKKRSEPWRIHFFQRHSADDPDRSVPTLGFFDTVSPTVAAAFQAILEAVAIAPPPAFSGGGKWEAMHGEMAGFYEAPTSGGDASGRQMNHRLLCLLVRDMEELGGPSIVALGGFSKPVRSPANRRDYEKIRRYAAEFREHRTVLQ
jgi:hypothetical protein